MSKKHQQNQVRIIGGCYRGRKLHFPSEEGLRPTADSVRERLFNWLGQRLDEKVVLDLFAGSGVLGIEAASRGAQYVVLVDKNKKVITQLKDHQRNLHLIQVDIISMDGLEYLLQCSKKFDVVLLDPPFSWQKWSDLLKVLPRVLAADAYVYMESGRLPELNSDWTIIRQGKAGKSQFELIQYCAV